MEEKQGFMQMVKKFDRGYNISWQTILFSSIRQLLRSYRVYLLSVKQLFYQFLHILLRKNHLTELNVLY